MKHEEKQEQKEVEDIQTDHLLHKIKQLEVEMDKHRRMRRQK